MFDNDFSITGYEIPEETGKVNVDEQKQIVDELKSKIEREVSKKNSDDDILFDEIINGSKVNNNQMNDPDTRPIYSQVQLDEAIRDAGLRAKDEINRVRNEGFEAGKLEAEKLIEQTMAVVIKNIDENIAEIKNNQAQLADEVRDETLLVCIEIIKKIMPVMTEKYGVEEILSVIKENLPLIYQEPKLVIKVAENIKDQLESKIKEIAAKNAFDGNIVIVATEKLDNSQCVVEWAKGGLERNPIKILDEIKLKLENNKIKDGE